MDPDGSFIFIWYFSHFKNITIQSVYDTVFSDIF